MHSIVASKPTGELLQGSLSGSQLNFGAMDLMTESEVIAGADFFGANLSSFALTTPNSEFRRVSLANTGAPQKPVDLRGYQNTWRLQAVGDLDGDGLADFVWRFVGTSANPDDTGVSYIWFDSVPRKRGGAPLSWQLVGAIDINADEAADMVYVSPTNDVRVLMATPNRTCANLSGGRIPAGFTALRFADFTGNRGGDLLLRNAATGATVLMSLDAIGLELPAYTGTPDDPNASCTASTLTVRQQLRELPNTDLTWTYYDAGDLDGDGIHDIVWKRVDNSLVVWLMGANGTIKQVLLNAGFAPQGFTPILH